MNIKEKLELFEDKNLGFPNLMGELISSKMKRLML